MQEIPGYAREADCRLVSITGTVDVRINLEMPKMVDTKNWKYIFIQDKMVENVHNFLGNIIAQNGGLRSMFANMWKRDI